MNAFMGAFPLSGEPWAIIAFQTFAGIAPTVRQGFRRAPCDVFSKGASSSLMRRIHHLFSSSAMRQLFHQRSLGRNAID
jgi:hypothetical protein